MPYGSNIVVGAKKASTWFTAVQLGALDGGLIDKADALWNLKRDIIPDESQGIPGLQRLIYGTSMRDSMLLVFCAGRIPFLGYIFLTVSAMKRPQYKQARHICMRHKSMTRSTGISTRWQHCFPIRLGLERLV